MTSKPFEESTDPAWGDAFAAGCSYQEVPSGYLFEGICPRCDDRMTYLVPTKINIGGGSGAQRVTHMMCTCHGTHAEPACRR